MCALLNNNNAAKISSNFETKPAQKVFSLRRGERKQKFINVRHALFNESILHFFQKCATKFYRVTMEMSAKNIHSIPNSPSLPIQKITQNFRSVKTKISGFRYFFISLELEKKNNFEASF